jgi:hypothetical protein
MNKWTWAGIGEFVGVILYTASDEFYGVNGIVGVAQMLGFGIPFALIGLLIGSVVSKKSKPSDVE